MQIGRYELIRTLGAGGSAKVLLAKSAGGREVVLKIPLSNNTDLLERVRDEARVGLRLQHPHIVETLDLFEHEGKPILVVEFVDGASLSQLRKVGALPASAVVRIGREIAEALMVIHEATDEANRPLGMLHRDVTAANILVAKTGEAKLIDLGIARSVETQARQTQAGAIRGTVRYLAPELLDGKKHSQATDLWALGVVLFEAALGRVAVDGDDRTILMAILQHELMKYRPGEALDPRLHDALTALLAKEDARLQKAKAAANIMRRLEVAFGDGREAAAVAVQKCIALGYTERSGPAIGEATKNVLSDTSPRPVTIPPKDPVAPLAQTKSTMTSGVTDPRAASSIDAPLDDDDDRAATVRMPAVAIAPGAATPAPTSAPPAAMGPVGSKAMQVDTQVARVAPISQSDLSSVSGRYKRTDIVPAYTPPSTTTARTEPSMPAASLPLARPVPAIVAPPPSAPASEKRAIPMTERNLAPLGSAINSQIATEVEQAAVVDERTPVVPLEPNEPTAAGLESQFGREPTVVPGTRPQPSRPVALPTPSPSLPGPAATILQAPAIVVPSESPHFGGSFGPSPTASGFRPPEGAVHSTFAEPTRETAAVIVKPLPGPPVGTPTSDTAPPTKAIPGPSAAPSVQATQMMHGGLARQALGLDEVGPSGTMPAMAAYTSDEAIEKTAQAPAPFDARFDTPLDAPFDALGPTAISAPPAELSEKIPRPLAGPPVEPPLKSPPSVGAAAFTPTGQTGAPVERPRPTEKPPEKSSEPPREQRAESTAERPAPKPVAPADKKPAPAPAPAAKPAGPPAPLRPAASSPAPAEAADSAGPPPPAEDAFKPTVTQAFFTKDLVKVMQDAEMGSSTIEMEAIRTSNKFWFVLGGGLLVLMILVGIVLAVASPDDEEKPGDAPAAGAATTEGEQKPAEAAPAEAAPVDAAAEKPKPVDEKPAPDKGKAKQKPKPRSKKSD